MTDQERDNWLRARTLLSTLCGQKHLLSMRNLLDGVERARCLLANGPAVDTPAMGDLWISFQERKPAAGDLIIVYRGATEAAPPGILLGRVKETQYGLFLDDLADRFTKLCLHDPCRPDHVSFWQPADLPITERAKWGAPQKR